MKAVMLSIQPKYCELIASGKKTIEVRKTAPKLETPFKCYIYCTASDRHSCLVTGGGTVELFHCCNYKMAFVGGGVVGNGKVIGEFVCDRIDEYPFDWTSFTAWGDKHFTISEKALKATCLSKRELDDYGNSSEYKRQEKLYGWHISDLKIYDKPKELGEFYRWKKCNSCKISGYEATACVYDIDCKVPARFTRPPQSWGYVEEIRK